MRLLSKNDIHKVKSLEVKRELDQGKLIANKIDTLRSIRLDEQRKLREWRDVSMVEIARTIDEEIKKATELKEQNKRLEEDRAKLLKPVDLTRAWEKVDKDKAVISDKLKDLVHDRRVITTLHKTLTRREKKLKSESLEVGRKEKEASILLKDAQDKHKEELTLRNETEKINSKAKEYAKIKKIELDNREKDIAGKERDIKIEHADIKIKRKELKDIQTHIHSQQDTLRTAWENIKRYER